MDGEQYRQELDAQMVEARMQPFGRVRRPIPRPRLHEVPFASADGLLGWVREQRDKGADVLPAADVIRLRLGFSVEGTWAYAPIAKVKSCPPSDETAALFGLSSGQELLHMLATEEGRHKIATGEGFSEPPDATGLEATWLNEAVDEAPPTSVPDINVPRPAPGLYRIQDGVQIRVEQED